MGIAASTFRFDRTQETEVKRVEVLARTDRLFGAVQVIRRGGETNLHSHPNMDGFWFVLRGAARFYTSNDDVLAELGPDEGILIPRDFPYWFESVGDAQLELLQVEAYAKPLRTMTEIAADRVDHAPVTAAQEAYRRTALSKRDAVAEEL